MEESSNNQPPRCPCGFWGSTQTLGLCSKCYCEAQENQTQRNILASDSGKPPSHCHTQLLNRSSQGSSRMDSKHFPSHSTTDNLPSSLSSPGERPGTLAAPTPSAATVVDSSHVTTSSAASTVSLLSAASMATSSASAGSHASDGRAEKSAAGGSDGTRSSSQHVVTSSSSDTSQSSVSTDKSYDPKFDGDVGSVSSSSSITPASSNINVSCPSLNPASSSETLDNPSPLRDINSANRSGPSESGQCGQSANTLSQSNLGVKNSTDSSATEPCSPSIPSSKDSVVNSLEGEEIPVTSTPADVRTGAQSIPASDGQSALDGKASSSDSPAKRGVKRSIDETEESGEVGGPSPQKNRKRCFTCSCKLELAQRTIGRCRCDRIFCALHRLPELHHCDFNHKEDGRREAREKMIVPTKHLGRSFRRDDQS